MSKTLTVHNAEVHTAAVEVKTLTISGKQVTLAVFRQLVERSPVTRDYEWAGLPWGFVNYYNKDRHPDTSRNVVWQQGDELRRGSLAAPSSDLVVRSPACDEWFTSIVHGGWIPKGQPWKWRENEHTFDVPEYDCKIRVRHLGYREDSGDPAVLKHGMLDSCAFQRGLWLKWRQRWEEILALPQLFIAV